VYTEPGQGCTFRTYFPPVGEAAGSGEAPVFAGGDYAGSETVLVAEDEPQLRSLIRRALSARGYEVLEASHGLEALEIAAEHQGPIHLLLTDVVMPHLSGNDLAARLRASRPDVRVLFVSGHSDEAIERHGVLAPDSSFLQKPIVPDVLARTVRDILDGAATPEGA
jgi:DNA-binding response OmpR family regulator